MSDHPYQPQQIESQVQQLWRDEALFKASVDPTKEKFFCLSMFPYPSGSLHMGHVRNYTLGDVISRFQRMRGKNVLQPIGWDAFGLPAENAAVANQTAPATWTYKNIEQMREQLQALGFGYDWSREVTTCRPDYYRWEQWFFTELMNKGLVYRKNATVNWDPVDQTVLANEQVVDGRGWRSGALVEQKEIPQWFIKITDYAQQLLDDLDTLDDWPSQVKTAQRNWIGRSTGAMVRFQLSDSSIAAAASTQAVEVYTTRPDTLFGISYLAIAAQHPLAKIVAHEDAKVAQFCEQCKQTKMAEAELAVLEKLGIDTGLTAIHPLTGQEIPIWIANFVLMDYGTGAVMAVPAHDQRDWEFAQKYQLPITPVIVPDNTPTVSSEDETTQHNFDRGAYTDGGTLIASEQFTGLSNEDAKQAITQRLVELQAGSESINYRLRDWGVSRQRYWGAPIPVAYDEQGNGIPIPEHLLPVELPENVVMDGVRSPIKSDPDWAKLTLNGDHYQRETDTFDTFMESSWYYARMASAPSDKMLNPDEANYWLPVDQYVGGIEHAILHLLYARFFHKLMRDQGLVSSDEPFKRLLCQGMVLADSFYREDDTGKRVWYPPTQVEWRVENDQPVPFLMLDGLPVTHAGMTKMSKSKNNGINPGDVLEQYGADTVRLFTMFAAPPEQTLEWNSAGVDGAYRFLKRIYRMVCEHIGAHHTLLHSFNYDARQAELRFELHACIQKVTEDYEQRQTFNTAIAKIMELSNALQKFEVKSDEDYTVARDVIDNLLKLLNPITPHLCQHLWSKLGHEGLIEKTEWPVCDPAALVKNTQLIVIQVNGKVRAKIEVASDADQDSIQDIALAQDNVQQFIAEKNVRKIIYVPGKLLNIVVG